MSFCATYLHYSMYVHVQCTYGDRLLIVFDKGRMRRFIVVIYNSEVYTCIYIQEHIIDEIQFMLLMFNKT
jgi:formylmethanofuran dehydrogenase subunit E